MQAAEAGRNPNAAAQALGSRMPNGRSGGFVIETDDLKRLVEAVSHDALVGRLTTGLQPQAARAAELVRYIEECPHDLVPVEEQDHTFYIIHLGNKPQIVWVVVTSESPIFSDLRRRHDEWVAKHPGWNGWMDYEL